MLVPVSALAPVAPTAAYPFAQTPLVVAFAAGALASVGPGRAVALCASPDLSTDDAYLVLPARAHEDLEAAFALGQTGRLRAWFDEAVVVSGEVESTRRGARLGVHRAWSVTEVLAAARPTRVSLRGVGDPLRVANRLAAVAAFAPGGLFGPAMARALGRGREHAGPACDERLTRADADPLPGSTFVWTVPDEAEGVVTVRAALALEDGSAHALLAPVAFSL